MLKLALAVFRKDLRLALRGAGLVQSMLLGLLLVFLFSLSQKTGETVPGQTAAAIFWLSSAFSQTLVFNMLFSFEEANGARTGLLLSPCPVTGIFLGKAMAGLVLILAAQLLFFPAVIVFLGQSPVGDAAGGAVMLVLGDLGLVALGSLLGALSQGQTARESLLSLLVFPLLAPLLLAAIRVFAALFGDAGENSLSWLQFAAAFDAIFWALSLLLFRFVYTGDD
ncbi:MAG: heme exporter protein CcmB [Desulfovibrionaceae bacterium]|nr:heme exporter protein CcmB [Desulfovibrionaceae bacterium]